MKCLIGAAALVCAAVLPDASLAEELIPDRIIFNYDTIRKLLPEDGKLVEQGQISKSYIGIALGHEVKADGKRVYVASNLGSPGVVFGDGYIKLHLGAHVEREIPDGGPTFAFDIVAAVILKLDEKLDVKLEIDDADLQIHGDNLGGKLAVAAKKELLKELVKKEVASQADVLTKFIRESKRPTELKVVTIAPESIEIAKTRRAPSPPTETIVGADLHFHTTNDDREGGIVKVEFYSDEATKFAEIPPLAEYPEWEEMDRRTIPHSFVPAVPVPGKIAFAKISLTEAKEINIGWNFEATLTLKTNTGRAIVFEGKNLRLDTTGKKNPGTASLTIPRAR